jgi:S-adenosylmethionine:tRNA ribosyltransferase-isomerase
VTERRSWPTEEFDYPLPPELIAQSPAEPRDAARLLVHDRASGRTVHTAFRELPTWLRPNDLLVMNHTRVIPARLLGRRVGGGSAELLLLERRCPGLWEALVRPGRALGPGATVHLDQGLVATIRERTPSGGRVVEITGAKDLDAAVEQIGRPPLPPYIHDWHGDPSRYQTVYATEPGSAAAPTAGLHFTDDLLDRIRAAGVGLAHVVLHVGLDTFRPVRVDDLANHEIHTEVCEVPQTTVDTVKRARSTGGRVIAVGTTTVRSLETAARSGTVQAWRGRTSLFIRPGFAYTAVDAMITNFHVPRSTLMALVCAFAGRDAVMSLYATAIEKRYRFLSFGDAMLIM